MEKKSLHRGVDDIGKAWGWLFGKNRKSAVEKTQLDAMKERTIESAEDEVQSTTSVRDDLSALPALINRPELERFFSFFKTKADRYGMRIALLDVLVGDCINTDHGLGQAERERLLDKVCDRIIALSRKDEFAVKLGSNELYFFVPFFQSEEELCLLSERLIKGIEEAVQTEGWNLSFSGRVGISIYPKNGKTLDELMSAANKALYKTDAAKRRYRFAM